MENHVKQICRLNNILLDEMPEYRYFPQRFAKDGEGQRRLLRSLMNIRPPMPLNPGFLEAQNQLLTLERDEKGVVDGLKLSSIPGCPQISVWQGDITRLKVDAIVNAANSSLLGCFYPCHGCIDNAIHSAAGLQLREACRQIIEEQGFPEPTGQAKITPGFNLPARYVIHTVGPVVQGETTPQNRLDLESCYLSCLKLAEKYGLESIAFCCISTGEFHFPNQEAAEIAVKTVVEFLSCKTAVKKVIFNVFKDIDAEIYHNLFK